MSILRTARVRRARTVVAGAAIAALAVIGAAPSTAQTNGTADDGSQGVVEQTRDAVPSQYIVTLNTRPAAAPAVASELSDEHGGAVVETYNRALAGYTAVMTEAQALELSTDPTVATVVEDGYVHATEAAASWGLDRIDARDLPLDTLYNVAGNGAGVTAYVIDTGIRTTHVDFGGRATVGYDAVGDGQNGQDCNGHGTHVAGTIGGTKYGVAKNVSLVSVRVLNCGGSGTWSGVIAGIDWVAQNHTGPSVANMSLGGGASSAVDTALANAVNSGVTFAVAAGNSNANACNYSPARAPSAITVGATDSTDTRSSFSNYGTCVDLFAPGTSIPSDYATSDTATASLSGTSMASPHVAGSAALLLGASPGATTAQVGAALLAAATPGKVIGAGTGSPNRLDYVGATTADPPPITTTTTSTTTTTTSTTTTTTTTTAPPQATKPGAPTNLRATALTRSARLTWSSPTNTGGRAITGYRLYRSTSSTTGYSLRASLGVVTTRTDTGLTGGRRYYYRVTAVTSAGESVVSNTASVVPRG